jgi:hypothetical protein
VEVEGTLDISVAVAVDRDWDYSRADASAVDIVQEGGSSTLAFASVHSSG